MACPAGERSYLWRVGEPKTASAAAAVAGINPDVEVIEHPVRLTSENALDLVEAYDLVADGSDNFATRLLANDVCYFARKPLVAAAIQRFDGQLTTFRAYEAGDLPCWRCMFGEPPGAEFDQTCSREGVLGALAGTMGALQATEVIKELLGIGETLAGSLLMYDALDATFHKVRVRRDLNCALCGDSPTIRALSRQKEPVLD